MNPIENADGFSIEKRAPAVIPVEDDTAHPVLDIEQEPSVPESVEPTQFNSNNIFNYIDTHPILLDVILFRKYGITWLGWEPETIWSEIMDDFRQKSISIHTRNKIQAIRTCHVISTPWEAWETFTVVCQAFNNNVPNFRVFQRPTIAQIMNTVFIMSKIAAHKFTDEVANFIAICFLDEGVYYLPPPVNFAQEFATRVQYRCRKCGKIDLDTENDMCDLCGAPEDMLEKTLTYDPTPVRTKYIERLNNSELPLNENVVDIQVAKLIFGRIYTHFRNKQLKQQLEVISNVQI
jgi:hypothetical protein